MSSPFSNQFIGQVEELLNVKYPTWKPMWSRKKLETILTQFQIQLTASAIAEITLAVATAVSLPEPIRTEVATLFRDITFYQSRSVQSARGLHVGTAVPGHDLTTRYMELTGDSVQKLMSLVPSIAGTLTVFCMEIGDAHGKLDLV